MAMGMRMSCAVSVYVFVLMKDDFKAPAERVGDTASIGGFVAFTLTMSSLIETEASAISTPKSNGNAQNVSEKHRSHLKHVRCSF